uniref:Uncharacterized protein n=1 Tax=viral metagenome TaxID=1070528 RepID=A0A6C0FBB9_9ZZZZ
MKEKSKDDLDLFMETAVISFRPYRKYHSMDAKTFYISIPKPPLTRSQIGQIQPLSK